MKFFKQDTVVFFRWTHGDLPMSLNISIELSDADLDYFRDALSKAQTDYAHLTDDQVIAKAAELLESQKDKPLPEYVSSKFKKLRALVDMLRDSEWQIPEEHAEDVISALRYFAEPMDLIPDDVPVFGFLDDAIMVDLVTQGLVAEIDAFEEFCQFRSNEEARDSSADVSREDWLAAKRMELHSRMRHRRGERRRGRSRGPRGTGFSLF